MSAGPGKVQTITEVGTYVLGQGVGSRVSSIAAQFEFKDSADASITLQARTQKVDDDIDRTLLAIGYKDDSTGTTATAAITANKSVLVDASAKVIYADVTTMTTGSVEVTSIPLVG